MCTIPKIWWHMDFHSVWIFEPWLSMLRLYLFLRTLSKGRALNSTELGQPLFLLYDGIHGLLAENDEPRSHLRLLFLPHFLDSAKSTSHNNWFLIGGVSACTTSFFEFLWGKGDDYSNIHAFLGLGRNHRGASIVSSCAHQREHQGSEHHSRERKIATTTLQLSRRDHNKNHWQS